MGTLKEELLHPAAYESATPLVELRETHASWVFLTRSHAYKLKKPVDLGFLDFRTLAQRKAACEAEVALNARLAHGVYQGVVPVVKDEHGRLHVRRTGAPGDVVEWAVRMKRLPDALRGDTLVATGNLERREVDALAERLAVFHDGAAHGPDIAAFGSPETIGKNVRENFAQTRDVRHRFLSPAEAQEIETAQTAFLAKNLELFARRQAEGRIRDGHGDLRLEHVYFLPAGDLQIIDCIEFNDRFRYGDVCSDIAFLSMDLAWHRRVDLAERLLASYARASNDYDLYALADFYESYRAYVRAKISAMVAGDEGAGLLVRQRATEDARRYFMLALAQGRRSLLAPIVVAVGGVIASGKSTVADAIADGLGSPVVSADRTRKHMLGRRATERVDEAAWRGAYDPAFSDEVYAEVFRRAEVVLASGRPVILDASFRSEALRGRARELARAHGLPFRFVECRASPETCRERLVWRAEGPAVSDGRLAIFDDFVARFEPITELSAAEHVVVDTARPLQQTLALVEERVDTWPRGLVA